MKSKQTDTNAALGGKLALALACTLFAGQAVAVPYASMIRFGEPTVVGTNVNVDLSYTLNEDADEVTVEVYNNSTATAVRTYNFTAPDVETTMGRHTILWDGNDDFSTPVFIGSDEFVIRVRVQKLDNTTEWTRITSNGSGIKATEKTSIFDGYSPNDIEIPVDDTSDQFGLLLITHSYNPAAPAGVVLLGTDLEPIIGDGGGAGAIKGQHIAALPGDQGVWKSNIDPVDPELMWWAGQTGTHRLGVFNIAALDPNDMQTVADNAWDTTLFPRSIAIDFLSATTRMGYAALGDRIDRLSLEVPYPHTVLDNVTLTAATIGGTNRYAQDLAVDRLGNLFFLSRLGGGLSTNSTFWRWNKADVDAAPLPLLDETNAAWHVQFPAGTTHGNAMHLDTITGNVYVGANNGSPRGVWLVGNVASPSLPSTPYVLSASDQILDFDNVTQFPVGFSAAMLGNALATDRFGNMYVTTRSQEEIYSFSPPGNGSQYDIMTQSPDSLDQGVLLVELENFAARSAGVGYPVRIRWSTSSEIDNVGFHIIRVRFQDGAVLEAGRVNDSLIPGAGSASEGATYSYLDTLVMAEGEHRGYVLVDIDANGNTHRHGPFRVQIRPTDPSGQPDWMRY